MTHRNAHCPSGTRPRSAARRALQIAEDGLGDRGAVGGQQQQVARPGAGGLAQALALGVGEELVKGRAQAVGLDRDPGQALGPAGLGLLGQGVELLAGQVGTAADPQAEHRAPGLQRAGEDPDPGAGEHLAQVDQLHAVAQVGLVGAEAAHGLGVGQARERGRQLGPEDVVPHRRHQLLAEGVHVLLVEEGQLQVELGELGLAVGPQGLVAEAADDLVVALDPGHHQQLLEQLGRLGQGVELPGGQVGGDQEVARPLGGRLGQVRGLDLEEPAVAEDPAQGGVGRRPDLQAAPGRGAAQVEVAVLEAQVLVGVDPALERERRGLATGPAPRRRPRPPRPRRWAARGSRCRPAGP